MAFSRLYGWRMVWAGLLSLLAALKSGLQVNANAGEVTLSGPGIGRRLMPKSETGTERQPLGNLLKHFPQGTDNSVFSEYLGKTINHNDAPDPLKACVDGKKLIVYFDIPDKSGMGEIIFCEETVSVTNKVNRHLDRNKQGMAKMFVALIKGCTAIETEKLWVNLQCSVVTIEEGGKRLTLPIGNFLDWVKDEREGLDDKERGLITEVLEEQLWTHINQNEYEKPTYPSLVNKLDIPSQIIHKLEEKFGQNTLVWVRKNGQHFLIFLQDESQHVPSVFPDEPVGFVGDDSFMNSIYDAIENLPAKKARTENDILTQLEEKLEELKPSEAATDASSSYDYNASGFPLAKPTGLADKAGDSSQSSLKNSWLECGGTLPNGGATKAAGPPRKSQLAIAALALGVSSAVTFAGWTILKKKFSGRKQRQTRGTSTKKSNSSTSTRGGASSSRKSCEGVVSKRLQRGNRGKAAKTKGAGDAQLPKAKENMQSDLRD
eukprot:GHVT01103556.1.p1 GENE.GHVT01103556.1~~GHVT01103556.1.p1  ORF type:complete len:490 (-),score=68.70 GHVT01103556.1:499-1968(-)